MTASSAALAAASAASGIKSTKKAFRVPCVCLGFGEGALSKLDRRDILAGDPPSQLHGCHSVEVGGQGVSSNKRHAAAMRMRLERRALIDHSLTIAKARTGEPEPPLNFRGTPKNWNSPLPSNSSRFTSHSQWLMPSLRQEAEVDDALCHLCAPFTLVLD